ncbi:MAG: MocR-like pyridoxine biosynthesis transcription factor PdxR [Telluria sp.]
MRHLLGSSMFELELRLPEKGSRQSVGLLHAQLVEAIRDGRLAPGTKMPPTRAAPALFGIARNTAAELYHRLLNEGLLVARQGSGTFVAPALPEGVDPAGRTTHQLASMRINPIWLDESVTGPMRFWQDGAPEPAPQDQPWVELRPALVDSRLFPFALFRQLLARQLRSLETKPPSFRSPQGNQGNYLLRQAVTRHVAVTRAIGCHAGDLLVTAGAQQAFDLLARVLVVPGETVVAVEDPGYPPMRAAFAAAGARIVPVPVDQEGLVIDAIPSNAAVICVTPSHQFPLGVAMSPQRRQALLALARRNGAVIVEDDYDGEFRFDGAPLSALRTNEAADHVFYVGTFSKCMLPALRLGFLIAPAWAMPALVTAKNCLDWHCPSFLQMGVGAFVADGHLTRHVRKMRQIYRQRRKVVLDALRQDFAGRLAPIPSAYGMHVTALLAPGQDAAGVAAGMRDAGFRMHTLDRYYVGAGRRPGLVFGYGIADQAQLESALRLLSRLLD